MKATQSVIEAFRGGVETFSNVRQFVVRGTMMSALVVTSVVISVCNPVVIKRFEALLRIKLQNAVIRM